MQVEIIPAVLPHTFDELRQGLDLVAGRAKAVQIDLVDRNILRDQEALPHWEDLDFEVDLMLEHPDAEVEQLADLGVARIVVHAHNPRALAALTLLQPKRGGDLPLLVGVALACSDNTDAFAPYADLCDYLQVMGIAHIGKQGEPFDKRALYLLGQLRERYPNLTLQVDGGVREDNVEELVHAGATRLVAGSAIFGAADPSAALADLMRVANTHAH